MIRKMVVLLVVWALAPAGRGEERVLGYITRIPAESQRMRRQRHKIIARRRAGIPLLVHRGASKEAPENTLEAYAAAMDFGADGVEIDVRRSKDGVLYLFHDATLDRETNGSGKVKEAVYYELLRMTPKRIYGRGTRDTRPPTLAAFLVLARGRAMLLHLDIKESGIQDELAAMLERMDMWDHVVEVNNYNSSRLRPPANAKDRDPNAPYNKVRLMSYKGWAPTPDGPQDEIVEAIRKWLPTEPGKQMVFCSDPRLVVRAMGRKVPKAQPIPNKLRAWWGPQGILKSPTDAGGDQKKRR